MDAELRRRLIDSVDEDRLVATASAFVDISSPTGSEQSMAECMREVLESIGLAVSWQEVEDGRPNVVGRLEGSGGAPSLMFNGHMDTSYSGREPHLRSKAGFQPRAEVRDGHIWGLGISNMKGALACYVEAARALADAGLRLRGDLVIAAVVGEIEKTQWGEEFRGAQYRGYAAGSRYLPTHGGIADMCILGEPTEQRVVLGHYGTMWAAHRHPGAVRAHRLLERAPGGERDSADAAGAGRGARMDPGLGAPLRLRRDRRRRQRRRAERRSAVARQPHAQPGRPVPRHPRAPDDGDDRRARGVRLAGARCCASATPTSGSTRRSS